MDLVQARELWQPQPGWLNTASYGLPPTPGWEALQTALEQWRHGAEHWEVWDASVARARAAFARLVGVDPANVTIGSAVSQLLAPVAASLPDGARVVVPDIEYTSLVFPFQAHADRGVEVVSVPLEAMLDAIDERTTVVGVSVVHSSSGVVTDLALLVARARAVGAIVVVDATQAVGWLPVDAAAVDVLACAAYKWLMSPRGTAFMVTTPAVRQWLRPIAAGWYADADVTANYYGLPMVLAEDARRFDISPAWFSWVGCAPTLELIEEIGVEKIRDHDVALANRFRAGLGMTPSNSAIVSVSMPDASNRLERAGIRAAARAGSMRAAFHLYTTEDDVDDAVMALAN
ncbi:MAG: aminotransferase class V-fold PLP-dependent enzyme [Candidatus Nanopelagicales bacterium]